MLLKAVKHFYKQRHTDHCWAAGAHGIHLNSTLLRLETTPLRAEQPNHISIDIGSEKTTAYWGVLKGCQELKRTAETGGCSRC